MISDFSVLYYYPVCVDQEVDQVESSPTFKIDGVTSRHFRNITEIDNTTPDFPDNSTGSPKLTN